ncbi:MAG: GumC family protein [Terriglobales bacterium]
MSKNFELLRSSGERELLKPPFEVTTPSAISPPRHMAAHFPAEETPEWMHALQSIQRHWRFAAKFAAAFTFCVALIVFLMKPVYEPIARIEVSPPGNELFSLNPGSPSDSVAYAETQAKNLQTDQLAVAVIRKLQLDRNPEFVKVPAYEAAATESDAAHFNITPAERRALKVFKESLQVQRDTASWLINVSFGAQNPKLAALVTNTIVEQFIETNYQTRHDAIVQSTKWLSHQLDDIRARMDESSRALAEFQKTSGITPVGNAQSSFNEKISELNKQLTFAQADRIQLEALLQKVGSQPDSLPQSKADPVVQELSRKLATTRADLRQALVIYGENHPKTKELKAQINELQVQIEGQQKSIYSNLKTSYAAAHTRENLLNSELKEAAKVMGQVAEYEALRKEAQANEALYNTLYTKVKEAGIAAESKSSNIRWVDRARVLDAPTRPRRLLTIFFGMLAGIVGGVVLSCVRGGLDNKVHTLDDVKSLAAGSGISLVPVIGCSNPAENTRWLAKRSQKSQDSVELFLLDRPNSAESEALLGLYTSVRLSRPSRPPQVLLIASAMASEGKTTIATNLSVALAHHGSACIVDADLRKQRVATIFGFDCQHGLSDVLKKYCTLEEALVPVPSKPGLTLLPAGAVPESAGELICSEGMREVIRQLRQRFQFVVVDSPPVLPYADARTMATLVDGVIFVGRSGVSTRQAIKRSLELLRQGHSAPVLDIVLNGVEFTTSDYRQYYYHGYK